MEKTRWKDFEIDVFSITESEMGRAIVTLNAQIPLKPRAIQVSISAPMTEEASLRRELQNLINSIQGSSNWARDCC